jgi:hypothetical protein
MKISAEGLKVLRNFSTINTSIIVHTGNMIRTVSAGKSILAQYVVNESFPVEFAIYDLNQFLSVVSLFDDPNFEFESNCVRISDANNKSTYFFADKGLIQGASQKTIELPDSPIEFTISDVGLKSVIQAAHVMKSKDIMVVGEDGSMSLVAGDVKNSSANTFSRPVGDTALTFKVIFSLDNIKMLPGSYKVSVTSRGISKWESTDLNLTYWVAVEAGSTFGI